jgi:phosphatidate cytidylyltransferase
MFWKRIISAIALIPIVIFLVEWGGRLYSAAIALITVLMLIEFHQLAQSIGAKGNRILGVLAGLLLCLSAIETVNASVSIGLVLTLTLLLAFVYPILCDQPGAAYLSAASTLLGAIYIGWAFGYHLVSLRLINGQLSEKPVGNRLIFFLLVTVWCADTAAYLVGGRFGRHKLRPRISPGKTVEGAIAALGAGLLGGVGVWFFLLKHTLSFFHAIVLSILLGIVSQFSDLSESLIKRTANVKDSGHLIPGHGGLLDRCDSLILSAPTLYYYFQYIIPQDH